MKTAILGAWHVHAKDYIKHALALSEVVGVYDENEQRKDAFAAEFGIKAFASLDELLSSDADGVIICTATNKHTENVIRVANAGKDIFTEKVLALSVEDCLKIKKAVEENNVRFVISFPWKFRSGPAKIKEIVDGGELGKVHYVRFRNCHSGSIKHWLPAHFYHADECGGGAMIDLGAHGMYLIDWLFGTPERYSSAFTHCCRDEKDKELNPDCIEDNAVCVMSYPDGTVAINETGFVSSSCPNIFEADGERGYVSLCYGKVIKCTVETGNKPVEVPLEADKPAPIIQFLEGKTPEGCGIDDAIHLTEMMVGAYQNK